MLTFNGWFLNWLDYEWLSSVKCQIKTGQCLDQDFVIDIWFGRSCWRSWSCSCLTRVYFITLFALFVVSNLASVGSRIVETHYTHYLFFYLACLLVLFGFVMVIDWFRLFRCNFPFTQDYFIYQKLGGQEIGIVQAELFKRSIRQESRMHQQDHDLSKNLFFSILFMFI